MARVQDAFASSRVVAVGAEIANNVARMQALANERGQRLLTFAIETDVRLETPSDIDRLAAALADAIEEVALRFDFADGRPHRIALAGFPTPDSSPSKTNEGSK